MLLQFLFRVNPCKFDGAVGIWFTETVFFAIITLKPLIPSSQNWNSRLMSMKSCFHFICKSISAYYLVPRTSKKLIRSLWNWNGRLFTIKSRYHLYLRSIHACIMGQLAPDWLTLLAITPKPLIQSSRKMTWKTHFHEISLSFLARSICAYVMSHQLAPDWP